MNTNEVGLPKRKAKLSVAADMLGVSITTLKKWVTEGRLKEYRVSQRVAFIDLDEVGQLVNAEATR
jgi:predicted site-specific integrase-resolvase